MIPGLATGRRPRTKVLEIPIDEAPSRQGRICRLLFLSLLPLLVSFQWLAAQIDSGTLVGTIQLEDGKPAQNAQVSILRRATNETVIMLTNQRGDYRRDGLTVGAYEIRVELEGFASQLRVGVQLLVGQVLREDFRLIRGDLGEVQVTESQSILSASTRVDRGQVIDQDKLETLPVNARDIGQLARRVGTRVLGGRRQDSLVYIDGTLFTHGDGGTTFKASTDALQEFDIKAGLYSSEYGIRPGAQIVAVTKSGSNDFHGSLFWLHRNDNFDARNFFEQDKAEFKRNQLGGTLGGPILFPGLIQGQDRAWFFLSYQLRSIRETKPLTGVVPTLAERQGEFSSPIVDPSTGETFPNNTIPQNRFDPVSVQLLPLWPAPNTPNALNFTSPDSLAPFDNPQIIARVDLKISPVSRWTGRFIWDSSPIVQSRPVSIFTSQSPLQTYGQSLSYTRTLGSSAFNVASVHLFRRPYRPVSANAMPDLPQSLGIAELLETEVDRYGVPPVSIEGYVAIGDGSSGGVSALGNWQGRDDLVLLKGNHSLKMGVEFRQHYNQYDNQNRSRFDFFSRYTGNALADFLLGHLAQSQKGGESARGRFHQNSFYFYFSDVWKVTPKLTLNLGLRHELRLPWVEVRGFMANFDPAIGRLRPSLLDLELAPGETGRFQAGVPLIEWGRLAGVQPRLGLSLRLTDRTVLRAGAGLYSNEPDMAMVKRLGRNPRPGPERWTYQSALETPTLALSDPFPEDLRSGAIPDHFGVQTPLPLATTQAWGLSLQHRLANNLLVDVGYYGSHTIHRLETVSLNDATPGRGDRSQRRPYPDLQLVQMPLADGGAWSDGLQLQLEKAPGPSGLSLLASFSWSRLIEIGATNRSSHDRLLFRSRNMPLHLTRGLADFHVPRRLLLTVGYDLPLGPSGVFLQRGWTSHIFRDWSLSFISNAQDGPWMTVHVPGDPLDTGSVASQWPDRIRDANLPRHERTPSRWFDTSAFVFPQGFRYGNAGKSTVEGPGLFNLDLSLRRTFHLEGDRRFEVRMEVFNATNRPNFTIGRDDTATQLGTAGFGVLGQALASRQIQLGLKFYF